MTFTSITKKALSPEEEAQLDVLDSIEFSYKKTTKNPSFAELIDTFPGAIPVARRTAKGMIKELKKGISGLNDFREVCTTHVQSISFKRQPELIAYYDELIDKLLQRYEKEIKKYGWQIQYLDSLNKMVEPTQKGAGDINPERIERAKAVPITELLEFKRGQAICPWHDDHKPSLKYYPRDNHVWCFAEGRGGDSIDVAMTLWGVDFKEAVRRLAV